MSFFKTILCAFLAVNFVGCSSYSSWTELKQDAPWGENQNVVTTWQRKETPSPLMVVGAPLYEESWKVSGKYIRTYDVGNSITRYLKNIGYIEKQKTTQRYSDGIQERVAEHRFFIVSLRPTVVIMTPYKVGEIKGRSNSELEGRLSDQTLSSSPLVNGYHYGSKVIRSTQYQWFSPDLKSGIQAVRKEGTQWVIDDDRIRIVMNPSLAGDWIRTERQR